MAEFKFTHKSDIAVPKIKDILPENVLRVYPYEFVFASQFAAFIQQQTVSIATISQDKLDTKNELLKDDGFGNKYFEMIGAITSNGVLDISTGTATYGMQLKEEDTIVGLSNWYYQGELDKLKIGGTDFMPAVFFIGKPYDKAEYEAGIQVAFIPQTMNEAKEGSTNALDLDPEGLYEFVAFNITNIEQTFQNSKVVFNTDLSILSNIKNAQGKPGITMEIDAETLIGGVKMKGQLKKTLENGTIVKTNKFMDIDFISEQPLTPFKGTPISVDDKVSIYADWFDFDGVLPWAYINRFLNGNTLTEALKVDDRTNYQTPEDIDLIKDMILISYLFATQFEIIPLVTKADVDNGEFDKSMLGKMRPDYGIGSQKIPVNNLAGKDPIKAVDGIYEAHIRKHPSFLTNHKRYQPIQGIINALCRYINSEHTIGKGSNAFGWAYLPWFLEPQGGIKTNVVNINEKGLKKHIKLEQKTRSGVRQLKYVARSIYFTKNFNMANGTQVNRITENPSDNLIIPQNVNLSNEIIIQTDRKLTLPVIPYQLQALNKLPLPGDINTQSSVDLMYNWYLPVTSDEKAQKLYLNDLHPTSGSGTETHTESFTIGNTAYGTLWSSNDIDRWLREHYPGANIIVRPSATTENGPTHNIGAGLFRSTQDSHYVSFFELKSNGRKLPTIVVRKQGISYIRPNPEYATLVFARPSSDTLSWHERFELTEKGIAYLFFNNLPEGKNHNVILNNALYQDMYWNGSNCAIYADDDDIDCTPDGGDESFSSTITYHNSLSYALQYSTFTQGTVQWDTEHITSSFGFDDRKVIFDKMEWKDFLFKFGISSAQKVSIDMKIVDAKTDIKPHGWEISWIDEVILKFLWISEFKFIVGGKIFNIPVINKTDETLTTQKIIFT